MITLEIGFGNRELRVNLIWLAVLLGAILGILYAIFMKDAPPPGLELPSMIAFGAL